MPNIGLFLATAALSAAGAPVLLAPPSSIPDVPPDAPRAPALEAAAKDAAAERRRRRAERRIRERDAGGWR